MAIVHPTVPSPSGVLVCLRAVGRRTVLEVGGEVDIAGIDTVAAAIDRALDANAVELWLDLSETSFMDSSGIHLLLTTRERLAERGCRLAVICPAGCVRRLFQVAGVSELLPLHESRSAANHAA